MRLAIYSDLHLECDRLVAPLVLPRVDCDVAIFAGDIHTKGRTPEAARRLLPDVPEILVVAGNHEFYSGGHWVHELARLRRRAARVGVRFLENDQFILENVRFLGCTLWTDFSIGPESRAYAAHTAAQRLNDYRYIKGPRTSAEMWESSAWGGGRLTPGMVVRRHTESVQWLKQRLAEPAAGKVWTKNCVISHHAPSMKSLAEHFMNDPLTPAYVSNQEGLFEHVDLWVHGHLHNSSDYRVGKTGKTGTTRVVANPRGYAIEGYPEERNDDFDPGLVIEI